jgi:hypothetical protein
MWLFTMLVAIGSMCTVCLPAAVRAQTLPEYDPTLAPYITGDNPPPGSGETTIPFTPPFNPLSPLGWFTDVLTHPNTAGSWDETSPTDPYDVNGDGHRDMSAPYFPETWIDGNGDGYYDSCGYQSESSC